MDQNPPLSTVLKYMPLMYDTRVTFSETLDDRVISVETPVYAAPAKFVNRTLQLGIFRPRLGLQYIPFGLYKIRDFITTAYDFRGGWKEGKRKKGRKYLPLSLMNIKQDVVHLNKKQAVKSYNIYTLDGLEHDFPFMLIEDKSEDGLRLHGFYRNGQLNVQRFRKTVSDPELWLEFVESLRNGEYEHPYIDNPEDTIQVSSRERKTTSDKPKKTSINNEDSEIDWSDPVSIHKSLDERIEGQHDAKKSFSVALTDYMTGIEKGRLHIKPVILYIGPTGVGKTLTVSHAAELTGLPKSSMDLQTISGTGYVGQSLSDPFVFIQKHSSKIAPSGYVVLNEIDKLAGDERNTWGPQIQRELLSIVENGKVQIWDGKEKGEWFDTSNLFIAFTGAFVGLDKIIAKRLGIEKKIGFRRTERKDEADSTLLKEVTVDDLIEYGLMEELVGRISGIGVFDHLTLQDKINILYKPSMSPLEGHRTQLSARGYEVEIEEGVLEIIARSSNPKTGARGLKDPCTRLFREIKYNPKRFAQESRIVVTPTLAEELLCGRSHKHEDMKAANA